MNQWISVNEKLPSFHDREYCLCYGPNMAGPKITVLANTEFYEFDPYAEEGMQVGPSIDAQMVTHWMPLPGIPNE